MASSRIKTLIMGAAGRDFHNFNTIYRDNEQYQVLCFTAAQIPDIEGRRYPAELAGKLYPEGIPIYAEDELPNLIKDHDIDEAVFAYSDVPYEYVMHKAALISNYGAHFKLISATKTMIKASKPVVSVCAVRTGCGKSQTTRYIANLLKQKGKKVVAVRHPMPYGDLAKQSCQRFAEIEDLNRHNCTIEEMEEYEPLINSGVVVYAGIDYQQILKKAEEEAEIIIWDGGNNDTPFFKPNIEIVVADPHRVGHELRYYPGEINLLRANVVIVNKVDTAKKEDVETLTNNIKKANPNAIILYTESPVTVEDPDQIKGKRVLVVEDGPTLTHGEMKYGAGIVAAEKFGASEIIDPRPFAVGSIKKTYETYAHIGNLLPAMGYGDKQIMDLEETINNSDADLVICATPIDLARVVRINKPMVRVRYDLKETGEPKLENLLADIC